MRKYRPAARAVIFGSNVSEMIDGATPMRASVSAKVLARPATAISHAPISPMPPARTCPSTAAMTGTGALQDDAQQPGHLPRTVDGHIPGVPAGRLTEVGSRAERRSGVPEHHHPRPGRDGIVDAAVQLFDQRGGQRVVVVRGVQRQPGDPALEPVADQHQ